jgi:cytochrome c553
MNKIVICSAALAVVAWQGPAWADTAANVQECMDCHELSEFQGMDAAALAAGIKKSNAEDEMMREATAGLSAADLQAVIDYIAAQTNK